ARAAGGGAGGGAGRAAGPAARRAAVVGRPGEAWKVSVTAPPADGRANDAVCTLLAKALAVPPKAVTIVSGHTSRDKLVDVAGLARDEIERRLGEAQGKDLR